MVKIVTEDYNTKQDLITDLSAKYNYEPWRVRIFDMQRASVQLPNPPKDMLPEELQDNFQHATMIMQGNGFTFTTSETSSIRNGWEGLSTPYGVTATKENGVYKLNLTYENIPVTDFETLKLVEIMGKPTIYYFPFKDKKTGNPRHTYLVVNPYENCAYRCRPCSRLPFFKYTPKGYEENIEKTLREVLDIVDSPESVRFINIITGSTPNAKGDIELYKTIIESFNKAGFVNSEYGVYTPNVESQEDMKLLRDMGVVFFTATMEVTTPEARKRFYGSRNAKGRLSFEEIVDVIKKGEEIFPYVNTNIMLGYEPADVLKENLEILVKETEATVNHFIPRIFLKSQLDLIHPAAKELEYYVDLCAFVERNVNAGRKSFGAFFEERFGIPQFKERFRS